MHCCCLSSAGTRPCCWVEQKWADQGCLFVFRKPQVLRYSALAAGLAYGVYHQSSLNAQARRAEADREYARKAHLIEQAKAEWKKKTTPQEPQTQTSGGMFSDRESHMRSDIHRCAISEEGEGRANLVFPRAVITDPADNRFDLEAYLKMKLGE